jgi:hypothetical protein
MVRSLFVFLFIVVVVVVVVVVVELYSDFVNYPTEI